MPEVLRDGEKVTPLSTDGCWRWSQARYLEEKSQDNLVFIESPQRVLITPEGRKSKWNVYTKIWLSDRQDEGQTPINLISKYENRQSAKELKEIGILFDFAKPVGLIKYFISLVSETRNSIVLDFFAGSSTTAHAVMQLNAEDGGNRKFIMVQLPELCDEKSETFKAGYKTIAEISKERIRRAGKKILETLTESTEKRGKGKDDLFHSSSVNSVSSVVKNLDIGFRVLKIDSSNMADVYYTPDVIEQDRLDIFTDNIKSDRRPEDLLFQVLLDWGVDLSLPIRKEMIHPQIRQMDADAKIAEDSLRKSAQSAVKNSFEVFFVDDNALIACFDTGVNEALVKELARFEPLRVVFRDTGFVSDAVKINMEQIFKQMSPGTEVKAI
jgi:adenine-specific DNA-methyltransferase